MRKIFILFGLLFSTLNIVGQEELNAIVEINSQKVQSTNKQVYATLKKAITEFVNQTKWTNRKFLPQERINCAFNIIVDSQDGNNFKASIQVQATRPVYGTSYTTPVLNINDTNFDFRYNEFDPLIFNPNSYDSNLVSTLVFYVYTILGVDADTFKLNSGQEYFQKAKNVALQAQQSGISGWQNEIGKQNRFTLIDHMLSPKFKVLRSIYYNYHRKGLDVFASDEDTAKKQIQHSVLQLERLNNLAIGNHMIRLFLDAKSDEIVNIFSDGKTVGNENKLQTVLQKLAPTQAEKWGKIKS